MLSSLLKKLLAVHVLYSSTGGQIASVNVKVTVSDANDNQPIFYPESYAGNVRLDSSIGDVIVVVKATDEDSGIMGNVTYTISGGNGGEYFNVGVVSGIIILLYTSICRLVICISICPPFGIEWNVMLRPLLCSTPLFM